MFELDIQMYAFMLLVFRAVSMVLMGAVIVRQLQLFKVAIPKYVKNFRIVLFVLALGIFAGNIIPAAIDALTLFVETSRPPQATLISILYSLSANLTALLSSYLIWRLYELAKQTDEITEYTEHALVNEKKGK